MTAAEYNDNNYTNTTGGLHLLSMLHTRCFICA